MLFLVDVGLDGQGAQETLLDLRYDGGVEPLEVEVQASLLDQLVQDVLRLDLLNDSRVTIDWLSRIQSDIFSPWLATKSLNLSPLVSRIFSSELMALSSVFLLLISFCPLLIEISSWLSLLEIEVAPSLAFF